MAVVSMSYGGRSYFFCSDRCLWEFATSPGKFTSQVAEDAARTAFHSRPGSP
jgi:YHS domain-containing protein